MKGKGVTKSGKKKLKEYRWKKEEKTFNKRG